jgi:hypothetical protein
MAKQRAAGKTFLPASRTGAAPVTSTVLVGGLAQSPGLARSPGPARSPGLAGSGRRPVPKVTMRAGGAGPYSPVAAVGRLVGALGANTVADLLGCAHDRPGRWIAGVDQPGPANRAAIADLDAVVSRLFAAFHPDQAGAWLTGSNAHLGGARPVDVFRLHGAGPVIGAIAAYEQGVFA